MKTVSKVRDFLIVINVKPSGFPVNIRCNSRPLLKTMLGGPKCYNMSLADSVNRETNRNFNRKLVIKWSIGRVIRVVS
jgi:hypothetical protein